MSIPADYSNAHAAYDTKLFRQNFKAGVWWSITLLFACELTLGSYWGLFPSTHNVLVITGLSIVISLISMIVQIVCALIVLVSIICSSRRYASHDADWAYWSNLALMLCAIIFLFVFDNPVVQAIAAGLALGINLFWMFMLSGEDTL